MMSVDELAARVGVPAASVAAWTALGLLDVGADGRYRDDALAVARLMRVAVARGLSAQAIAAASERHGDLLGQFAASMDSPSELFSVEEAADRLGLPVDVARRVQSAADMNDPIDAEDLAALHTAKETLDAGVPERALLQLLRVYSDSLGRVADAEVRLVHSHVHDALRADGLVPGRVPTAVEEIARSLSERAVAYFHRKARWRAVVEDALAHLAAEIAPEDRAGEPLIAVLFVDLVGFTSLTDVMGDEAAADVVDRFSELVRDEARHCDGRVVKQIGDEFMLVFPDTRAAVSYALHLADIASEQPQFPALRMGLHAGAVIYREADYLGATVNLAARVAGCAAPGELVVTGDVRRAAGDVAESWTPLGARPLRGVRTPVDLFATALRPRTLPVDPVCGMTVDPAQAVVRDGGDEVFCSEVCRARFEEAG